MSPPPAQLATTRLRIVEPAAPPATHPLPPRLLLALALGLSLLSYAQVWRFDFVYDDDFQIVNNSKIHDWSHLRGYFTSHVWANAGGFDRFSSYYRPLFLVWLRVNYACFGLDARYWHALSLALHLVAVWLAYLAALRLLEFAGSPHRSRRTTAAIAALLFALHPAHVEPVAWISAASELLLTIFFLLAFIAYVQNRVRGKRLWLAVSAGCFALALLAKETAIMLVPLLLCCELTRRTDDEPGLVARLGRALRGSWPWVGTALLYLLARRAALGTLGHGQVPVGTAVVLKSLPELFWFYARHLLWPWPLAEFYDVFYVRSVGTREFVIPAVAMAVVLGALWAWARRSRVALLASLWVLFPLLPVLDVALLRFNALAADRYLYLPSLGFCVLAAVLLVRLTELRQLRRAALAIVLGLAAVMGVVTARQAAPWENALLLYENAVAVAPGNALAKTSLAVQLMLRGEEDRARKLLLESYAIDSYAWATSFNLGCLNFMLGDLPQAERFFQRAIWLDPHNRNQFLELGLTQKRMGNFAAAAGTLAKTAEIWPEAPLVHLALGEVLEQQGRYEEARREFEKELGGQNPAAARVALARLQRQ
ncbi:MAG: tetratricopeptide repeat protein [Terriglobales bacterium]